MTIKNALAGVAVTNLDASVDWYTRLLRRGPDQRLMPEVAEWRFPGGGWCQVFEDTKRAGSSSLTMVVDDLDATLATLKAGGFLYAEPSRTNLVDTAILKDLDGNQIVFAQSKSSSNQSAA
jgi:hypothetical protein